MAMILDGAHGANTAVWWHTGILAQRQNTLEHGALPTIRMYDIKKAPVGAIIFN